jgi:hypothetical protein
MSGGIILAKGDIVTFRDEWLERRLYGYAKYEITYICNVANKASVRELKTNHLYTKVNTSELKIINFNLN